MLNTEQRTQMLDTALHAFDRSHARRRAARAALASACFLVAASVLAWSVWGTSVVQQPDGAPNEVATTDTTTAPATSAPTSTPARADIQVVRHTPTRMPAFVEVLQDVDQLAAEMDAAGACEGIGREGDRVFIVECAAHAPVR